MQIARKIKRNYAAVYYNYNLDFANALKVRLGKKRSAMSEEAKIKMYKRHQELVKRNGMGSEYVRKWREAHKVKALALYKRTYKKYKKRKKAKILAQKKRKLIELAKTLGLYETPNAISE